MIQHFGSIDAVAAASVEELQQCSDVGEIVAQSIFEWFRQDRNGELMSRLRAAGLQFAAAPPAAVEGATDKLSGTSWVITGTLSQPRPVFEELIKKHGGRIFVESEEGKGAQFIFTMPLNKDKATVISPMVNEGELSGKTGTSTRA